MAVEVPVILDKDDIDHFRAMLNFDVPLEIEDNGDYYRSYRYFTVKEWNNSYHGFQTKRKKV